MPHDLSRFLAAVAREPWAIDPAKAAEIVAVLEMRLAAGPAPAEAPAPLPLSAAAGTAAAGGGAIQLLRLHGTILPRAGMIGAASGAADLEAFVRAFRQAAADPNVGAIVIDVDSPGGRVDLVQETAALIHGARREDRPIVAVANTLAASAAYWLAAAADELAVTPSGSVGAIGVYTVYQDSSRRAEREGVSVDVIAAGPRKAEGVFGPLDPLARAALQARVAATYDAFVRDVARFRGVPVATVRADPEEPGPHFGGGRVLHAAEAVRLGMADRVATLDETLRRIARGRGTPRTRAARARLQLI